MSAPEIRLSIMLGRDHTSKYVGDRLSKYVALKRIDNCREGEISDSISETGSGTYVVP